METKLRTQPYIKRRDPYVCNIVRDAGQKYICYEIWQCFMPAAGFSDRYAVLINKIFH